MNMSEKDSELVAQHIKNLLEARAEFFKFLDEKVPKIKGTDVFDWQKCEDVNLKTVYEKFYAFDYGARKLLPYLYEAYEVKFSV